MSATTFDKTLIDYGRRELNLREYRVEDTLSEFIVQTYPKLVGLLKEYYHFENEEVSPSRLIDELFYTRDITQTDLQLLSYIEDEYLLGQSYFSGFANKRDAAKFSNTLYRSKGSKYSIQQFFRTFFNLDPNIIYTKGNIFNVGESKVGSDSQRYITDDKLYQKYALLIRSDLSINKWRETYKLFAHPAGMYLGAEVELVGVIDLNVSDQPDPGLLDLPPQNITGDAGLSLAMHSQHTALFDFGSKDAQGNVLRFRTTMGNESTQPNAAGNDINDFEHQTIQQVHNLYSSMGELLTPDSPTLDEDDATDINGFDISSTESIDQERFSWVEHPYIDSDNSVFLALLDSDGSGNKVAFQDSDGEVTLDELL